MINDKQIIEYVRELSETKLLNLIAQTLSDMGTKSPSVPRQRILHARARLIERWLDGADWLNAGQIRHEKDCNCIECYLYVTNRK